jgi:hypothetical protein
MTFDETGFERQGEQAGLVLWRTPHGDMLSLFHHQLKPDIGAEPHDVEGLRRSYREIAREEELGVIEIEWTLVDGCPAVRTLFKAAQEPAGRIYGGALTIPFRDFSYIFKTQCEEEGTTGMRDTMVLMQLMAAGESAPETKAMGMTGWLDDPYDAQESGPLTRNKSERPEYDAQFPDHPLSRVRRTLDHLAQTVKVSDDIKRMPAFSWQG